MELRNGQQDFEFGCDGGPKEGYLPILRHGADREPAKSSGGDVVRVIFKLKSVLEELVRREFQARKSFEATDTCHNGCGTASQTASQRDLVFDLKAHSGHGLLLALKHPPRHFPQEVILAGRQIVSAFSQQLKLRL